MSEKHSPTRPEDAMARLAQVAPDLNGIEHTHDYEDERLMYQEMTDVARFLVSAKKEERVDVLKRILNEVEQMLTAGDEAVRDLLIVGLLEDTQNFSMQGEIPLDSWKSLLGRESKKGWIALERMWSGKMKPADFNKAVAGDGGAPE